MTVLDHNSVLVVTFCLIFEGIMHLAGGGSITWYEPPPFEITTDAATTPTARKNLTKGFTNAELSCNFSLTDLSLITASFKINGDPVATYVKNPPSLSVEPGFNGRLNATWIPSKLTLIVFDVTAADKGEYRCEVITVGVGVQAWSRIIQVDVLDPPRIASISFNQTVAQEDVVLLNCTADGNPVPNITWTRLSDNSIVRMPLNITGKQDEGSYRCTAYNGIGNVATSDVFITVQFYRPINTVFSSSLTKNKVRVEVNFTLICNADANPSARYRLYKGQESLEEHSNGSYLTHITNRIKQLAYICIPFNSFGDGPSKTINVTIYYPPKITSISLNQTVAVGDVVVLNCTADGNPKPNITWSRLSDHNIVSMPLDITGKQNEGGYRCTAHNGIGNVVTSDVFIAVQFYRPINTVFSTSLTNNKVNLSDNFTLTCNADANPPATYRLYRGQQSLEAQSNGTYLTSVSNRAKQVTYRCIPFNSFGDGPLKIINVTVYYASEATGGGGNYSVFEGSTKLFSCPVDGNPEPNITWYKDNEVIEPEIPNAKQIKARETGCYTCSAINALGPPVTITQCLIVVLEEPTSATPTSTGKPTKQVYADLTIMEDFLSEYRDLSNQVSRDLVDSFVSEMNKTYQNDDNYLKTEVTGLRSGSVIVSFTIYFKNAVTPSQEISKLEAAISDGTFGTYQVGSLILLSPGTGTFTSTTPRTSQPTEFQCACDSTLLVIIGVLVAIIIVLILVIAWQHRKLGIARKKRPYKVAEDKDRRIYDDMLPLARQADQLQDGLISRIWLSNPLQSHCHGSESFN